MSTDAGMATSTAEPKGLVFLSYSREDGQWARRLMVILNPALRELRLELWGDAEAIVVGDEWQRNFDAAIDRATAAVLLISPDYLASRFLMEHELPRLQRGQVPLFPVLVRASLWQQVPALAEAQWPEDPNEPPLAQVRNWEPRMVTLARRIHEVLAGASDGTRSVRQAEAAAPRPSVALVEAVPTHLDRPAVADSLNRAALAEVLSERLRRVSGEDTERPTGRLSPDERQAILVHLHAPWGAGKSSLLHFLRHELECPSDDRLKRWIVIDFNAWQHQRVSPPWSWMLAAVRRDGLDALWSRSKPRAASFWVADGIWRLWSSKATWLPFLLAIVVAVLAWQTDVFGLTDRSLKGVEQAAKAITAMLVLAVTVWGLARGLGHWLAFGNAPPGVHTMERVHDPMRAAKRRFHFLADALRNPIAVFIDDIDRCSADYVVELLEGVQTLFLDRPIAYVVAGDREWLCQT